MKWRIKKKKGLLKDPEYEKIRDRIFERLNQESAMCKMSTKDKNKVDN